MIFCTLSDDKYLLQGLALVHSIKNYSFEDYKIYYLCLDDNTYNTIEKISKLENLKLYPISYSSLERKYPQILDLKSKDFKDYCFSFSALLPKYIFEVYFEENILYVDSDTMFYYDPKIIYDEIGYNDVGIIRHRFNDRTHPSGEYNANVIYFRNTTNGNKVLDWWHVSFMTKNPARLSTCGDQKYMEGFENIIGRQNICVIDDKVGHGAPWNFYLYKYDKFDQLPKIIQWENKEQIFVFNHFSQFYYDFNASAFSYSGNSHLEYTFFNKIFDHTPFLKNMYIEYYEILKLLNLRYNLNIGQKQ